MSTENAYKPGSLHIYQVPFVDTKAARPRPVLITSLPNSKGEVMGIPGSSQLAQWQEPHQLVVQPENLVEGQLQKPTVFPVSKQMVFSPRFFRGQIGVVDEQTLEKAQRLIIQHQVTQFQASVRVPQPFNPGVTPVPPAGKVIGTAEIQNLVEASLDGWLTTGRFNRQFEKRLAKFLGVKHVLTVNSGSSANLVAFSTLTSPKLGDRAIRPGDEVIGVAAGFPTTVNPILQCGAVPVFVDVDLHTLNIDATQIEQAISPKTKAIMLAHTLGNPFNLDVVTALCKKYNLWLVEDCCDALGSTYRGQLVGTFGDIATLSFYPAHHITMGEGGAVFTNNSQLKLIAESFRDWGRDCFCQPGQDNSCGKRFCWTAEQLGGSLPDGYDHKYIYSHVGYNLKITDMQAACGLAQLDRLEEFIAARKANFAYLRERLQPCKNFLCLPEVTPNADPSWFGFPITLRETSGIKRVELLNYLNHNNIGTRLLFAGNLTRQPYMIGRDYMISGDLVNTDIVMNQTFWLGLYPGLQTQHFDYMVDRLEEFFHLKS